MPSIILSLHLLLLDRMPKFVSKKKSIITERKTHRETKLTLTPNKLTLEGFF